MDLSAKTQLLADVGGTNTRVAIAQGGVPVGLKRFANAAFSSFYALLGNYAETAGLRQVDACSVAMAGPVRGGQGRLTNRNWHITTAHLQKEFGCSQAVLMNDLTALGYALPSLPEESLCALGQPDECGANGQSLVIGIGTGFNLCPVLHRPDGSVQCLEVEMGHAALATPLKEALVAQIGDAAQEFATLEHLFSGSGLASFHQARCNGALGAKDIVLAQVAGEPSAQQTLAGYTKLLGVLCGELTYQYMPMNGVYFAGSVARGVLRPEFHQNLTRQDVGKVSHLIGIAPKAIILDDAAALRGCLAALDQGRIF